MIASRSGSNQDRELRKSITSLLAISVISVNPEPRLHDAIRLRVVVNQDETWPQIQASLLAFAAAGEKSAQVAGLDEAQDAF